MLVEIVNQDQLKRVSGAPILFTSIDNVDQVVSATVSRIKRGVCNNLQVLNDRMLP